MFRFVLALALLAALSLADAGSGEPKFPQDGKITKLDKDSNSITLEYKLNDKKTEKKFDLVLVVVTDRNAKKHKGADAYPILERIYVAGEPIIIPKMPKDKEPLELVVKAKGKF